MPCTGTCEEPNPVCTKDCRSGCGCPDGDVVNDEGTECINPRTCPKMCELLKPYTCCEHKTYVHIWVLLCKHVHVLYTPPHLALSCYVPLSYITIVVTCTLFITVFAIVYLDHVILVYSELRAMCIVIHNVLVWGLLLMSHSH